MTRVAVSGARDWDDKRVVSRELRRLRPGAVVQGGAPGADSIAAAWAIKRKVAVETFPAEWDKHGRKAGPLRNKAMVDSRPDYWVAFMKPGSRGTSDFVQHAVRAGIPGHVVYRTTGGYERITGSEALYRTGRRKRPV